MTPDPTFLDRLLGRDPVAGLAADLERALNTRPDAPDVTALDPTDATHLRKLARVVARLVRQYDPRCDRVTVTADEQDGGIRLSVTVGYPVRPPVKLVGTRAARAWKVRPPEARR